MLPAMNQRVLPSFPEAQQSLTPSAKSVPWPMKSLTRAHGHRWIIHGQSAVPVKISYHHRFLAVQQYLFHWDMTELGVLGPPD